MVVHARENGQVHADQRLVLFPPFNRNFVAIQVLERAKPLDRLGLQVAVGHGMANRRHQSAFFQEEAAQPPFLPTPVRTAPTLITGRREALDV